MNKRKNVCQRYLLRALITLCGSGFAEISAAIEYDHLNSKSVSESFNLDLGPTEYFDLEIKNTCASTVITAKGFTAATPTTNDGTTSPQGAPSGITPDGANTPTIASCSQAIENIDVKLADFQRENNACLIVPEIQGRITNDENYTGYIVNIDISKDDAVKNGVMKSDIDSIRQTAANSCTSALNTLASTSDGNIVVNRAITDAKAKSDFIALQNNIQNTAIQSISALTSIPISDTNLVVNTNVKGWITEFSGGVLVSSLTDDKFRVDESDSVVTIVRNKSAEDKQRLELGAFTHVFHSSWEGSVLNTGTPAITAGISVNSGDSLDYFIAGSIKFGSAYLNLGVHWGQVSTGPTSLSINTPLSITAAEATTALNASASDTHTDNGIFVSISYTFAGQGANPVKSRLAFPQAE